ncbi:MAG: hypothetical protein OEX80_01995, partial [Candidatus Aminicenantes bacterium]|nr:hypothetical protein [Candidatus Aminicenantes bacterium]
MLRNNIPQPLHWFFVYFWVFGPEAFICMTHAAILSLPATFYELAHKYFMVAVILSTGMHPAVRGIPGKSI